MADLCQAGRGSCGKALLQRLRSEVHAQGCGRVGPCLHRRLRMLSHPHTSVWRNVAPPSGDWRWTQCVGEQRQRLWWSKSRAWHGLPVVLSPEGRLLSRALCWVWELHNATGASLSLLSLMCIITTGHKVGQNHRWKNRPGRHVDARVPALSLVQRQKKGGAMRGREHPPSLQLSAVVGVR